MLVLIIVGALAGPALFTGSPVFAHANLARSNPSPNSVLDQPPDRVIIWFTEPIEPGLSEIQVLDAQGQRVDNEDSSLDRTEPTAIFVTLRSLPNGTFTVAWTNVSTVDGHRVRGSFVFSVGEPITEGSLTFEAQEQPLFQSPLEPVLRWLVLLGALAVVGGLAFELLVVRPVLIGRNSTESFRHLAERLAPRALKFLWLAMGLLMLSSVAQLIVQAAVVHDIPPYEALGSPIRTILAGTEWGRMWLWRVGLLLAMAASLSLIFTVPPKDQDHDPLVEFLHRLFRALALSVGAGMLLTLSLVSHGAATAEIKTAAVFSDYLHLLAAGFWVGGLFHFALAIPVILVNLPPADRTTVFTALVPRFSTIAFLSVGILVVTGLYGAWAQVTIWEAVATPYGWTLVAKLGLVLPLLSLGALNLLWVRPKLGKEEGAGRWLSRVVTGEALLAVLVLLSVGVLISLEPARQYASRQGIGQSDNLTFSGKADGSNIVLDIEPGRVGPNRYVVSLEDRLGVPITNATDVSLRLTYLDADLGEGAVSAASIGDGTYVLEKGFLSIAGPWQVELVVRRPDAFDARTAFRFEATSAGSGGSAAIAPGPDDGKLLWGIELILLGLLFLATGIPLGGWWNRNGAVVMGSGTTAALAGLVLLFNAQVGGPGSEGALRNPFPPEPQSLEAGQGVYVGNCLSCHGVTGKGNGPASAGLAPPPADLVVHVPLHPERELFQIIRDGVSGTAMAPQGGDLSDEEIWHTINYIRTLE
jgi:copper transport protein